MHEYKVEVEREGRWWMLHVSDIDGLTQARRISEIEEMARSLIAISTDTPLDDVAVHITSITVPGVGDVAEKAAEITRLRAEAQRLEAAAGQAASDYAKVMTREGVPVRDIAELLDISPQRVSQIANSTYEK
jgi:hypothetical protein